MQKGKYQDCEEMRRPLIKIRLMITNIQKNKVIK